MTTYFVNCKNLDELKKAYKAAAMKNHPDKGGDTATMQAINAEYSARFEVLKRSQNEQAAEDTTGKTYATTESTGGFIEIINVLLHRLGREFTLRRRKAAFEVGHLLCQHLPLIQPTFDLVDQHIAGPAVLSNLFGIPNVLVCTLYLIH